MALISVLVPTYNEEDNVTPLSQVIRQQFEEHLPEYDYEILFIDCAPMTDTSRPYSTPRTSGSSVRRIMESFKPMAIA